MEPIFDGILMSEDKAAERILSGLKGTWMERRRAWTDW